MLVVVGLLVLVVIGLAVALARTRAGADALAAELEQAVQQRTAADAARRAAEADAASSRKERDDALERANRAKRDASDVARRMKQEAEARSAAEAEQARLAEALEVASASTGGSAEQAAELWALALAGARRTWDVSVAPSPGMASPLDGAEDELRAAVEIEVDAAREEAGAAIDLDWRGDAVAPPVVAIRALAIVQELVARLAKTSAQAVVRVTSAADRLVIEVEATDDEGRSVVPSDVAADHRTAAGRFELAVEPVADAAATGARPGR